MTDRPELFAAESVEIRLELPEAPEAQGHYRLTGDVNFDHSDELMLFSEEFRIDGNALIFNCDTRTTGFLEKALVRRQKLFLELTAEMSERSSWLLCQDWIYCSPRVDVEGVPPEPMERYYTRSEVDALLVGKLDAPSVGNCSNI